MAIKNRREADRLLRTSQSRYSRHSQQTAMQILIAIHRLAETGAGRVKTLQVQGGEKRLRVGDFRVRFTKESGDSGNAGQDQENEGVLNIHTVRNRKDAYR